MKIETQISKTDADNAIPYPALTMDWDIFGDFLDNSNLSDDEKREFAETIWYIVVTFVDLGFGIEPVQQALQAGGKDKPKVALPLLDQIKQTMLTGAFDSATDTTFKKKIAERGVEDDVWNRPNP